MKQTPTPPKVCPVCQIAMQATETDEGVTHYCQNCGLVIEVAPVTNDEVSVGRE